MHLESPAAPSGQTMTELTPTVSATSVATITTTTSTNCAWYSKMSECLRRNRNQVEPLAADRSIGVEYFTVAPRRVLRVLKPELKSEKFYEPAAGADRPESLVDNFYSRWARRPHPSGNCRCSFRNSVSRLSSHEEQIISRQINRIRTSLCEAERSGISDIEELEKSLAVDLSQQLDEANHQRKIDDVSLKESQLARIDCLDECAKKKIVRDLDRYISELLDEILNDTIRAAIERERQDVGVAPPATFDISFAFHNGSEAPSDSKENNAEDKGYVNRGFVGTANDPDTLDFCLRNTSSSRNPAALLDCLDSGINSVETVELQTPEHEDEHNLEQSLMDIIDAKLGGSSIGKSLEDLGMEIDAEDATLAKAKEPSESQVSTITEAKRSSAHVESQKSTSTIAENSSSVTPAERGSKSLDTIEEPPPFNSLRLEFKRISSGSSIATEEDPKQQQQQQQQQQQPASSFVSSKVNKTVLVIRQRLATRLASRPPRTPKKGKNNASNKKKKKSDGTTTSVGNNNANERPHSRTSMRAALELEDYRRRFPVPETSRRNNNNNNNNNNNEDDEAGGESDEVTLRNRKPMIVFLHGFGSSAESFGPQLSYFANLGYPCVAPDLLGHGFSSAPNRPKDYQFDRLLNDLEAVLLHYAFKPGQKCVLVAHNYGCSFAAALAYKYSSNVHQLVLISGGGPTPLAPPPAEGAGRCCLRASLAPFLVCGMNRAVLYSARGRQHPYCGSEDTEDQRPSHMRHVLRGMSWPDGDYVFHRRICTPTLLVHGLRDNKVSLVQECQMERTMVKAFLEAIPSAGHVPMTDCPEQLNHMINCFIDLWKNKKW